MLEVEIRDRARSVARLFRLLDEVKLTHDSGGVRSERVMKSRPGSAIPGNALVLDVVWTCEIRLREWCQHFRPAVDPGRTLGSNGVELCQWVAFHAAGISECMTAAVFLDALRKYEEVLGRVELVRGRPERMLSEKRVSMTTVLRHFPDASYARVKSWVKEGVLTEIPNGNGNPTYRLSEIEQLVNGVKRTA